MNIELKCEKCLSISQVHLPDKCHYCLKEESNNDPVMIETKRQYKWFLRKRLAYIMLLYVPLCFLLSILFGFRIEIAFICGTLYSCFLPNILDWLDRIF